MSTPWIVFCSYTSHVHKRQLVRPHFTAKCLQGPNIHGGIALVSFQDEEIKLIRATARSHYSTWRWIGFSLSSCEESTRITSHCWRALQYVAHIINGCSVWEPRHRQPLMGEIFRPSVMSSKTSAPLVYYLPVNYRKAEESAECKLASIDHLQKEQPACFLPNCWITDSRIWAVHKNTIPTSISETAITGKKMSQQSMLPGVKVTVLSAAASAQCRW